MKRWLIGGIAICTMAVTVPADPPQAPVAATQPPAGSFTPLMRMKLERSKVILEALTLEDFDKLAANARALRLLSTEAGWNVIQTKEYASQSRDFQRSADLIAEAAEDKDIHRAALGYVSLTVRCVECHSYMRKHRIELMKHSTN